MLCWFSVYSPYFLFVIISFDMLTASHLKCLKLYRRFFTMKTLKTHVFEDKWHNVVTLRLEKEIFQPMRIKKTPMTEVHPK